MYEHVLKVYDEDLYNDSKSGVVKAQGNMGGLVVRLVANKDTASFASTTVTVKQGDEADKVTEDCVTITGAQKSNVKAGELIAEVMLPWNVKRYVTATVDGATDDARVTLGYLPR